jgi:murein endopeptidase
MFGWLAIVAWLGWSDVSHATAVSSESAASFPSAIDTVWIRTPLLADESLAEVAARHDVSEADLRRWNAHAGKLERGVVVKVRVRADAPALQPIYASVNEDETWDDFAARHGVTADEARASSPGHAKRKRPPARARLVLWVPTRVRRLPAAAPVVPIPAFDVPEGGVAVGKPHRGRLENGVRLPDSELYTIRFDRLCYGTSLAVRDIQTAIATFRHETGFDGEIFIGAMSRKSGRTLRPHRSHRTGRDVDVRMPALPFAEGRAELARDEIDWSATWALIDAFVRTGDVHSIFLERKLWERLKRGALRTGATDEQIARAFEVIKHSKGHTSHVHVRFQCGAEATECED